MIPLILALSSLMGCSPVMAEPATPTAAELLDAIDSNLTFETRKVVAEMDVVKPRRTKSFTLVSYSRGADEAATEYLSPARDAGTRMLKKGDEMWIYMPSVEKVQKISGHMLRQGMMGSDISYEDMMESASWQEMYTATVTGLSEFEGRPCWNVEMIAKDNTVTYPKRVTCVDKEAMIPVNQELYALSGMLLKRWTMHDVVEIEGKQTATRMRIVDSLQEGTYTDMRFTEVKYSVELEDEIFSMRWLER